MAAHKVDIMAVLTAEQAGIDSTIAADLPRPDKWTEETVKKFSGEAHYSYDPKTIADAVMGPMWNLLDRGGKRWRPVLLMIIARALGGTKEQVSSLVTLCEVVHNASLVIDDIEDDSLLRRGLPCLHLGEDKGQYKMDVAINAGCAMFFLPTIVLRNLRGKISDERLVDCYDAYSIEMTNLHFGQGMDIWWHNGKSEPNEEQYLQMCAFKTGTLARLSAKLSAIVVGGSAAQVDAVGRFAEAIGVAFQIQDDILCIAGDEYKGHATGEDITEGKRTLMVLYARRTLRESGKGDVADRLDEILRMKTTDAHLIEEAIKILKECGSIEQAKARAVVLVKEAWSAVDPLLPESEAKAELRAFADYLIDRKN